jgi:hypothetical protein
MTMSRGKLLYKNVLSNWRLLSGIVPATLAYSRSWLLRQTVGKWFTRTLLALGWSCYDCITC